jgi:hypothetical protein
MRIRKKRFAGKTFNSVQVVPVWTRLRQFIIFAVPAAVFFYFYPRMYEAAAEHAAYYLLMLVPVLLVLFAMSRAAQRVVVYIDPEDRKFVVVKSGLITSREKLNVPASDVKGVSAETKVVKEKSTPSGDAVRKTKTTLSVKSSKGEKKLQTYRKAAQAQKAARLIEDLIKE